MLLQCPKVTLHPVSPVSVPRVRSCRVLARPAAAVTWQHTRYNHCTVGNTGIAQWEVAPSSPNTLVFRENVTMFRTFGVTDVRCQNIVQLGPVKSPQCNDMTHCYKTQPTKTGQASAQVCRYIIKEEINNNHSIASPTYFMSSQEKHIINHIIRGNHLSEIISISPLVRA